MKSSSDSIGIDNTQGDVIASKVEGMGTIAGKEVHVTIEGNVFNIGNALKDNIKEIIESSSRVPKDDHTPIENSKRIKQAKASEKNIQEIMYLLKRIEYEEGISPTKIKAGEYDISADSLLSKKHVLEGNKYFFKREYNKAIEYYDKAIDIEPYDSDVWYNKGCALEGIKKYDEAIKCYDNAIDIDPQYSNAWHAKGNLLYQKTAKQKIIISMTFYTSLFVMIMGTIIMYELNESDFLWVLPEIIGAVFAIAIPLLFLFFCYKEGIIAYRRLDYAIKIKILIIGISFIVLLWIPFILSYFTLGNIPFPGLEFFICDMAITATFFLFLYNSTSSGEYYLNKARQLGKKNI